MSDFSIVDDGTLDTVVKCNRCGTVRRYTCMPEDLEMDGGYEAFERWALKDAAEEHDCDDSK